MRNGNPSFSHSVVPPTLPDRRVVANARMHLLGLDLDALTMQETIDRCRDLAHAGGTHQHVVLNAAKVVAAQSDDTLRSIINTCDVINADGQAVVWAGRFLGHRVPERVAGIDLFLELVRVAADDGDPIFLLGAEQSVVDRTARVLRERHPRLQIAGIRNGFWSDDDEVISQVRAAKPTYLFLAIPSPRKEFWLNAKLEALGVPFAMGVGGSFDVVAGKTRRAPKLMQRMGLEWSWRLLQEPRRMFKRYWNGNRDFIKLVISERQRLRAKR